MAGAHAVHEYVHPAPAPVFFTSVRVDDWYDRINLASVSTAASEERLT